MNYEDKWDEDGFLRLRDDEEVVVPEPYVPAPPPPPPPPPVSRAMLWGRTGIPSDLETAVKRMSASRAKRAGKGRATFSITIPKKLADGVDLICDEYDVARQRVIQKFVEDGIRELAKTQNWPDIAEKSGLAEKKQNPFEEIPSSQIAEHSVTTNGLGYHSQPAYVAPIPPLPEIPADIMLPNAGIAE